MPKTTIIALAVLILISGCSSHEEPPSGDAAIPPQFTFIFNSRRPVTLQEVTNRVGKYSRVRGKKARYYEFDFPDGGAVLIGTEPPFTPTNRIVHVECYSSTNALKSFP